jgi:DNA-directed RNA polymerase subunit M/transcription elongation factor TFIIS
MILMTMETFDPAAEWLRISERYRQMSDGELLALAQQSSELTEVAQQALAGEIARRGLKVEAAKPVEPVRPEPEPDSPYAEDLKLVEIARVWSLADAAQLQDLLDRAGIPVYMGKEKAALAERVTSNFAEGVSVKVPQIGVPWARQAMENYSPANEPTKDDAQEEVVAYCPKCHSTEIFFGVAEEESEGSETESEDEFEDSEAEDVPEKYEWVCETCGNRWKDEEGTDGE